MAGRPRRAHDSTYTSRSRDELSNEAANEVEIDGRCSQYGEFSDFRDCIFGFVGFIFLNEDFLCTAS